MQYWPCLKAHISLQILTMYKEEKSNWRRLVDTTFNQVTQVNFISSETNEYRGPPDRMQRGGL